MMEKSLELSQFYESFDHHKEDAKILKKEKIRSLIMGLKEQKFKSKKLVRRVTADVDSINNTFFTDFLMYRKENATMEENYLKEFNGDINLFIEEQKIQYGKK